MDLKDLKDRKDLKDLKDRWSTIWAIDRWQRENTVFNSVVLYVPYVL